MRAAREAIDQAMASGAAVYGVNTGFGNLANVRIDAAELSRPCRSGWCSRTRPAWGSRSPRTRCAACSCCAPTRWRAATRACGSCCSRGCSSCSTGASIRWSPSRGSVGASGDLAPLAHLALPLLGRGEAWFGGERLPGAVALERAGLEPVRLAAREGLALVNGTQAMTALAALAALAARRLVRAADLIGALSTEALRGTDAAFDARVHAVRPHPGQRASAANLWQLLQGSAIRESHRTGDVRVQDPYSIRCMPQVHGAVRDVLADVEAKLAVEMNSATDNPLVFARDGITLSGGNFHGEPIAFAADFLAIALAELASISERRIEKLTNDAFSGLPPFLVENAGLNSGFMMAQVTAAALVSENKVLAHPASVDSIPTSADKEDHVSMGMTAALKLRSVLVNARRVLAIELVAAAQGIDLLRPLVSSPPLEALHALVRGAVPKWTEDREMAPALAAGEALLGAPLDPHIARLG